MKIMLLRYGIGRGHEICIENHSMIADKLSNFCDLSPVYVFNNHQFNPKEKQGTFKIYQDDYWTERAEASVEQSKKFADVHDDNYRAMKNLFQQFEMLAAGHDLALTLEPNHVLFMRDDIIINPDRLLYVVQKVTRFNKVWFSAFHGNNGYCERFGILPFEKIALLNRYKYVNDFYNSLSSLKYVLKKGMNGEWLYRYIVDRNCTDFVCSYVLSRRVRNAHEVVNERMIPRPWHLNTECKIFSGVKRYYFLGR